MIRRLGAFIDYFFEDSVLATHVSPTKRLTQVRFMLTVACTAWALLLIAAIIFASTLKVVFPLAVILLLTLLLMLYANEDTYVISAGMFLWGASIVIAYFSWTNGGLWDEALFAYPCILTMAVIFNMQAIFIAIMFFSIASIVFFGWSHSVGLLATEFGTTQTAGSRAANYTVLILIFSLCVQIIYSDFKSLLIRMIGESERAKNISSSVARLATTDKVTELSNEHVFYKDFLEVDNKQHDGERLVSVSVYQLVEDHVSSLSLDDQASDGIYKVLADRLTDISNEELSFYFFRGGKFVVLYLCDNFHDVEILSERILRAFTTPLEMAGYHLELKVHGGVSTAPCKSLVAPELMVRQATIAMIRARKENIQAPLFYSLSMGEEVDQHRSLRLALKGASDRRELSLYYQPKIDLSTGEIYGAEALLRWNKPGVGFIGPDIFIPMAEESGEIIQIGEWVIREACSMCKSWHRLGYTHLTIAVNLSVYQFRKGSLPYYITNCLNEVGLAPSALELEITESMLGEDVASIQAQINQLTKKGVKFSIDDFGTGYSNLGYVSKFNTSFLKIDRSFVAAMLHSDQDLHIVKAIVNMAKGLEMEVVAEGVENSEEVTFLQSIGCQYGQGYLWSKAVPEQDFAALLANSRRPFKKQSS